MRSCYFVELENCKSTNVEMENFSNIPEETSKLQYFLPMKLFIIYGTTMQPSHFTSECIQEYFSTGIAHMVSQVNNIRH